MSIRKRYKRTTFDLVTVMCSEGLTFFFITNEKNVRVVK